MDGGKWRMEVGEGWSVGKDGLYRKIEDKHNAELKRKLIEHKMEKNNLTAIKLLLLVQNGC